jgi:Ca2+-binding RTX toxin-like protein
LLLLVVVVGATMAATAAKVTIASAARAAIGAFAVTPDQLKPPECASITVTVVRVMGAPSTGASLFVGTAGNDNMVGGAQSDCIVGGAGNDTINGGAGTDVCVGGPGTDTFTNCETAIQ